MENRLAAETSPYLLQHKDNPVDWYPWGDEALRRAKEEDKPIFLSVGYSSCHWCHVMAHESFENAEVAALLNAHFVSIKVDREERPDIDEMYMKAVQLLTGQGGWPMSVFLTPELKPFYGGTYFPPTDRYGRPGFVNVLGYLAKLWKEDRARVEGSAKELLAHIQSMAAPAGSAPGDPRAELRDELLEHAADGLAQLFDAREGGFGGAPKFPHPMDLALLLRIHARGGAAPRGKPALQDIVRVSLEKMARGGIYDQLGGGFHRYSTDDEWLVPHFEKMLYDNALLAPVYAEAHALTGVPMFARVARDTVDYVLRELSDAGGGFHSAQDADSEGVEGKFFVWTRDELRALLDEEEAARFEAFFGVDEGSNFEHGTSILRQRGDEAARAGLGPAIAKVFAARAARVHPGQDDKVLVEWNGLMLSALARVGALANDARFVAAAERCAGFLLDRMTYEQDGALRLLRTYRAGAARVAAFLPDHANLIQGLLDLAAVSARPRWLEAALRLNETVARHFADAAGGFLLTADDQEQMLARSKDPFDNAVPSGNSVMASNLLRLAEIQGDAAFEEQAIRTMASVAELVRQAPTGFGQMLQALDLLLHPPRSVVIAGTPGSADGEALRAVATGAFRPGVFVLLTDPAAPARGVAILEDKVLRDGKAAAYVCSQGTCLAPITDAAALRATLDAPR